MSDSDEIRHGSDRKRSDLQVGSLDLGYKPVPEGFMDYLNSLNENNYIITVPTSDTRTTTTQASLIENDIINEINQMIDEIYLNYIRINHLPESEKKSIETIITNLRNLVMKIISSLNEHIITLNNETALI